MEVIATDARLGHVLADRYRLISVVGVGAFASVYLGSDLQLRRKVAIKVLHPGLAHDKTFLQGFGEEAQAAASLSHPNVMQVHDSGNSVDGPFIVMELLSGGSLSGVLETSGPITVSQMLQVGFQAAAGLDAAHRRNIPHRDMKPANLMFDEAGRLRVADFGLARVQHATAMTEPAGSVTGTVKYLPPEAGQRALDSRADIFSLAMTLIESVTGTVPNTGSGDLIELLTLRRSHEIQVGAELGAARELLQQCVSIDPALRPTAREMAEGIRAAASKCEPPQPLSLVHLQLATNESTIVGNPFGEPRIERAKRKRRWPRLVALGVVTVLAIAAALFTADKTLEEEILPVAVVDYSLRTEAEITNYATENGWLLTITRANHDEVTEGRVISMGPIAGTELFEGDTLTAVISLGVLQVEMTEVKSLSPEAAQVRFVEDGFVAGTIDYEPNEDVEDGVILRVTVDGREALPGDTFDHDTVVDLAVSSGPEPRVMPVVAGLVPEGATLVLDEIQLGLAVAGEEFSETVANGLIISADFEPGANIARDTIVQVLVSKGRDLRTVPIILGETLAEATRLIEAVGLHVGLVRERQEGANIVFATGTGQEAGTRHPPGTAIDLVLN